MANPEEWLEEAISSGHINKFDHDKFTNRVRIGSGGFGTVYKCEWRDIELTVALKCLKVDVNLDKEIIQEFIDELKLLRKVCWHQNIIRFYGVVKDHDGYYMVLQFANNGNLREYLRKNFVRLQWADKLRIAKEIVHGIVFLHNNNIIHRDLHSMNILIHQGQIKIADFGLAKQINETSKTSNSAINGITPYIDPQCLINHKYKRNKKSDIYSLGVILWEISSGRPPFQSFGLRDALAVHIFLGNREEPIEGTPPQYVKLYKQCWDMEPDVRPEARAVFAVLNKLNSNEESAPNNDSFTSQQDNIIYSNVSSNFELQNSESQSNIKMQSSALPPDLSSTINFDLQNTSIHYDYTLEKKRKEVHKNFNEGCYVKALELYEEILADNLHNSMDRHNASNWNISYKSIDSKQMNELTEIICKNTILTSLDLRYSKFGSKEGRALAKALCKNTTLTSLNLGYIQPGFKEGKSLAEALCKNTNLTSLNLRYNQLGPEEGKSLAKALYKNTTLISLNISSNYIGSEGGKALANALRNNSTLTFLDLAENQLDSQSGKALAEALCKNTTLTTLNLAENQLGPVGGEALAKTLYKNTTLTYLNLYNNQLYSEGGKALAKALRKTTTLTFLDLRKNQLDHGGKKALEGALNENSILTLLK